MQSKIRLLEEGQFNQSKEGQTRTEIRIVEDERSEGVASVTSLTRDSGKGDEVGSKRTKTVEK